MKYLWTSLGVSAVLSIGFVYLLGYPKLEIKNELEFTETNSANSRNPGVRFTMIRTANAGTSEAFLFEGGNLFKKRIVAHSALLVEHPKGKFLFDTGLGTDIREQFALKPIHLKILMAYTDHIPVVEVLQKARYDLKQIGKVYLSHMHWDHASGIKDFPWAKIITTKEEREAAIKSNTRHGYIQRQFDGDKILWENISFDDVPYESYSKSLDLYGDGSIVFVPMEGHGGGSVGLFVNLSKEKRYFFTGDISWSKEGFLIPAHKPRLSRRIADAHPEDLGKELNRVHKLVSKKPEIQLIPSHDSIAQESLAHFPNWNE
ncbi:MBL fold metallo-hydrolase [Leptospira barantonii]|uniref:MBL fold metallo-hydrolase n=1 Tax=Leptospira barantonii TaxID=2023184 RepID=A0A5F2AZT9_9LEPT|nr:MBL fold metallo-hydrolase [Leptospira barantonii]TGL96270.1 MBL fold metallo-hydrolase [Leptospira barantonii]